MSAISICCCPWRTTSKYSIAYSQRRFSRANEEARKENLDDACVEEEDPQGEQAKVSISAHSCEGSVLDERTDDKFSTVVNGPIDDSQSPQNSQDGLLGDADDPQEFGDGECNKTSEPRVLDQLGDGGDPTSLTFESMLQESDGDECETFATPPSSNHQSPVSPKKQEGVNYKEIERIGYELELKIDKLKNEIMFPVSTEQIKEGGTGVDDDNKDSAEPISDEMQKVDQIEEQKDNLQFSNIQAEDIELQISDPEEAAMVKIQKILEDKSLIDEEESEKIQLLYKNDQEEKDKSTEETVQKLASLMNIENEVVQLRDSKTEIIDDQKGRSKSENDSTTMGNRLSKITLPLQDADSIRSVYNSGLKMGKYGMVKIKGEVLFALNYDYKSGTLVVNVKECKNLAAADPRRNRSDPHIKVYLLPDKSRQGKRKTRTKFHTFNPKFNENLEYIITISELETRTLWLTVWHMDRLGQNIFLGEVTLPLGSDSFQMATPKWHPLTDRLKPSEYLCDGSGEINLAIRFVPPTVTSVGKKKSSSLPLSTTPFDAKVGSLQVLIKQARNLVSMHATLKSDTFCKCYLLPKSKKGKQKTQIVKNSANPVWNSTLIFSCVTEEDLKDRCLELTIWDHDPIASNIFLGGIRLSLGLGMFNEQKVSWMDSNGEEVRVWSEMLQKPNQWIDTTISLRKSMYVLLNKK